MVKNLGNRPNLEEERPDQSYFPVLGRLIHYPANGAIPLAVLAGLGFLGAIVYGFRKKN